MLGERPKTAEELNAELYEKVSTEFEEYKNNLLMLPPEQLLEHAYAYAIENQIRTHQDEIDLLMEKEETTQGDPERYFEKTDSIKKQIEDLRVRRNKLLSEDEDERCIEELRHLKRILNDSPKTLSEIDKELFASIVTKIYAEQNGDITFCLLGELQLRMEVK